MLFTSVYTTFAENKVNKMAKQEDIFIEKNSEEGILNSYIEEISSYAPLTDEQEKELSERVLKGDKEAAKALVNANLKFVVSVARQYAGNGVSMLDLINEGNIALLRAALKYDAGSGKRFSSYAVWGVRKAMKAFCPEKDVRVKSTDMDNEQYNRQLPDDETDDIVDRENLAEALSMLPERERLVLKACYGIGTKQMTMRETGEHYGMTRERVRQIRKRALRRLHEMKKKQ